MKIRQLAAEAFVGFAVGALSMLMATGQTCVAQTTGESAAPSDSGSPNANPDPTPQPAPTPTPQTGTFISGLSGRVAVQKRVFPEREDTYAFNLGNKHLEAITGGITQGAGMTFGLEYTTADYFKWVEFRVSALASTKLYRRFEAGIYIPKIGDENTHGEAWVSYLRRTKDNFYGIGPLFPKDFKTNFDLEQRSANATVYHNFGPRLLAGVYARVANSGTFNGEHKQDIPMDQLYSGDPNVVPVTRWAPGFQTNTKIFSYGVYGEYDRRNNDHGLTRGFYAYGRFASADGLNYDKNPVFQDYGWLEGELDGRVYVPLFSDRTSLAVRAYSDLKSPKGGSQIPFYDLSFLGGRNYVRGFANYRFRGNNSLLFSGELRQTVWRKTEDSGLDVFGFCDVGQVWGDNRSKTDPAVIANDDYDSRNWRTGAGGGFQYRISKSFAARVELGRSNERNLIYFSFSHGF